MQRGVAIALGASAVLHVVVLVVLDAVEPPPRRRADVATRLRFEPLPPSLPPSVPIDVSMVIIPPPAEPPAAAALAAPVAAAPTSRPAAAPPVALAASAAAAAGAAGTGAIAAAALPGTDPSGTGPPGRSDLMTMRRGGGAPDLDPRKQALTVRDDPDAPPPWTPPPPSGELQPSGGGTHEQQRPGFVGHVAADGKVSFDDRPAFEAKIMLPNPAKVARRAARGVEGWFRDPGRQVRAQRVDKSTCHLGGGDGTNNCLAVSDYGGETDDGSGTKHVKLDEPGGEGDDAVLIPLIGGRADITDWVMRRAGQDPYQSDKLRWMDATRDERVEIRRAHQRRQLDRVDELMRRHLDRLWARTDLDLAAKRAALFELWDDGAEDGDAIVVEAAARTRKAVLGFVAARLPAGSAAAYTVAELAALNRRRTSRAVFAPYP